jgi:hypothetical protein
LVVGHIGKGAQISVVTTLCRPQKQIDAVDEFVVDDELAYLSTVESLSRLGLPCKDTVLSDSFIEDMVALLLAIGHEEHEVAWPLRDGDDPV